MFVSVFGLHLIALNVLYPEVPRQPIAAQSFGGGIGVAALGRSCGVRWDCILAIPLTAAMKIVFDHVESLKPFGTWLGE